MAALLLGALCLANAGGAAELPFTPEFAAEVEATFFTDQSIDAGKVEKYRRRLDRRRSEEVAAFTAARIGRGRTPAAARAKALQKKEIRVFDLLLGDAEEAGWLAELNTRDPVSARRLAGTILELDRALEIEGELPRSFTVVENLASISVLPWKVRRGAEASREASNLVDPAHGGFLGRAALAAAIEAGTDLSELGPPSDSTFWRDPGAIADRDVQEVYFGGGDSLHAGLSLPFPTDRAKLDAIRTTQTKPKFDLKARVDGVKRRYKLKVGAEVNSEPVAGALLTLLGFDTDIVRHVRDFRIDLGDTSIESIREAWRSYFEFDRIHLRFSFDDYFEVGHDQDGAFLIAREATLAAKPEELIRVGPWPYGANGNEGLREVRGLGVLSLWLANSDIKEAENNKIILRERPGGQVSVHHVNHDLGHAFGGVISEQINALPWTLARRGPGGTVRFAFRSTWNPSLRTRITRSDARWMTRLIGQLSREQITEAVALGGWPDPVARLLVEKLIHRRNSLVEAFGLVGEPTASGPIEILQTDRHLTTADGRVVDGVLVDGVFESATRDFDNYWGEMLGPIWDAAVLSGVGVFQETVGLVPAVVFDVDSVDAPRGLISQLVLQLERRIEANPIPTHEGDHYLVFDRLALGARIGAALVAGAATTFFRRWTLVRPAGTRTEAHHLDDRILDLRLPQGFWTKDRGDEFLLVQEDYVDLRAGLLTEDLSGSVPPVGATASIGRVRLSRTMLGRRDGRLFAYRDQSRHVDTTVQAFANAVFVHVPLIQRGARSGTISGTWFELPDDPGALRDELERFVRGGPPDELARALRAVDVESKFESLSTWARLPFFARWWHKRRLDRLRLDSARSTQFSTATGAYWKFLDWGEAHRRTVRAQRIEDDVPVLEAFYFQRDRDTHDRELAAYLPFVANAVGPDADALRLTPELHSSNGRWGDLEVTLRVRYPQNAVERLLALESSALEKRLAGVLGVPVEALEPARPRHDRGKLRRRERRLPLRAEAAARAARKTLHSLARARRAEDPDEEVRHLGEALGHASFRFGGSYDPAVLEALHDAIGREHLSIEARVAPPKWVENRLPGGVALRASAGAALFDQARPWVEIDPRCPFAWYTMLESFGEPASPGGCGLGARAFAD
ncbi:MAG: hypothetical protein OEP95_04865, partial [Myxococcales bacterium]|nr:hypothetical protein [Myxococcales bacterium]